MRLNPQFAESNTHDVCLSEQVNYFWLCVYFETQLLLCVLVTDRKKPAGYLASVGEKDECNDPRGPQYQAAALTMRRWSQLRWFVSVCQDAHLAPLFEQAVATNDTEVEADAGHTHFSSVCTNNVTMDPQASSCRTTSHDLRVLLLCGLHL